MKHHIALLFLFTSLFLVAGCSTPAPTEQPEVTSPAQNTVVDVPTDTISNPNQLIPTNTLEPTLPPTPTIVPPTPTAPSTPTSAREVITKDNLSQITNLAREDNGSVQQVSYSQDGQWIMIVTSLKVILNDAENFSEQKELATDATPVNASLSPDSSLLAAGYTNGYVLIWDVNNGTILYSFSDHKNWVNAVAFSPDGKWFASGSRDQTIFLRSTQDWNITYTLKKHTGAITQLAFSPDSALLVSSSLDQTARLWSVEDGTPKSTLLGHTNEVKSVGFSPDGQIIVTGSSDGSVRLWQSSDGKLLQTISEKANVESVSFSPSGEYVVAGILNNSIDICKFNNGNISGCKLLEASYHPITTLAFSPRGDRLVSGGNDPMVRIWNFHDLTLLTNLGGFAGGHYYPDSTISPFLDAIAFKSSLNGIFVQKLGDPSQNLELQEKLASKPIFSSDGKMLAHGAFRSVMLWDLENASLLHTLEGFTGSVQALSISPTGQVVAAGSDDGSLHVWDMISGDHQVLGGHTKSISQIVFSPDGNLIGSGSEDRSVLIWDANNGTLLTTFGNLLGKIQSAAFSPDGTLIAASTDNGNVYLWQVSDEKRIWMQTADSSSIDNVVFHPGGQFLSITTSAGNTIQFLDVETGNALFTVNGIKDELYNYSIPINRVAFSEDGTIMLMLNKNLSIYSWGIPANTSP